MNVGGEALRTLPYYSEVVAAWARINSEIYRAWIYGSYAVGEPRHDSDLDVAIKFATDATRKFGIDQFWRDHQKRLEDQLQALVGRVRVQLEMYDRYHGKVAYRAIISHGIRPAYKRPRELQTSPVFFLSRLEIQLALATSK